MWKNPMQATPSIIQVDFGAYGQNLPGDGEMYCAPTSVVMGLYYLSANGFTQLAPATYGGQEDQAAINFERVIAGLMGTTAIGGTGGGFVSGVVTYLSACGLSPDQYTVNTVAWPDFADRRRRRAAATSCFFATCCRRRHSPGVTLRRNAMYLARFSYDVLPVNRQRAIDFILREVKAARGDGLNARLLVPLTRHHDSAALQFELELARLDQLDQFRERGVGTGEETGNWMRAFSEILVAPPVVEILRVAEVQPAS